MERYEYNNMPDTRARVAARRRARTQRNQTTAVPGARRAIVGWMESGRIVSLILVLITAGMLTYIAAAPEYAIHAVDVQGNQALGYQKIVSLADADQQSIWLVDTAAITARLSANPYVEAAHVSVALPDRLTITLRERRPEVRWRQGGQLYVLDNTGKVLGLDETGTFSNTLVIDDQSATPLKRDDRVNADALSLSRVLSLRLPNEFGLTPQSINWDTERGVFIQTPEQRTIIFGDSNRLDEKLQILSLLLTEGTPFTLLDLRPSTPFFRNDAAPQS